jgi:hypothetical protein
VPPSAARRHRQAVRGAKFCQTPVAGGAATCMWAHRILNTKFSTVMGPFFSFSSVLKGTSDAACSLKAVSRKQPLAHWLSAGQLCVFVCDWADHIAAPPLPSASPARPARSGLAGRPSRWLPAFTLSLYRRRRTSCSL